MRLIPVMGLAVLLMGSAAAETVEFQDGVLPTPAYAGTRDTIIKNGTTNQFLNNGPLPRLRVTTQDLGTDQGPNVQTWTLLRWDISAWVPPGAVVTGVQVTLDVEATEPGATTNIFALRRLWTEGDGTAGSGATWVTFDGTSNWGAGGAGSTATDYVNTVLGTVPGTPAGPKVVTLNAAGVAAVQAWADDPAQNFGLLIRDGSADAVDYGSRETPTATRRPRLSITFTPPTVPGGTPTTVTFRQGVNGYTGARDAHIRTGSTNLENSNYGVTTPLVVDSNGGQFRSLLAWDTTSIPTGSTVTAATITLQVSDGGDPAQFFEVLRPWTEGSGNGSITPTTPGATWRTYDGTSGWGQFGANLAGTDYDATLLGTLTGAGSQTEDLAIGVVQGWVDTPANNRGLILRPTNNNNVQFVSKEGGTPAQRPALTVTYTPPSVGGVDKTINGGQSWQTGTWSPPGVPGANDRVTINGPGTVTFSGGASTVRRIVTQNGGSLTVDTGTLTVSDLTWVSLGSVLTVNAGATFVGQGPTRVLHTAQLFINGGTLELGTPSCWLGGTLQSAGGNLIADVPANRADVQVRGTLSLNGLTVRDLDAQGLHVFPTGTVAALRDVRFESHPGGTGAFLTVEHPGPLSVSAPGCWFDTIASGVNARLVDTLPATVEDVVLNFEDRGSATNGPGVGEARDADDDGLPGGGASVNWVFGAPDGTAGTAVGFPQMAWDLTSFAEYAIYAAFRDASGNEDRIYVFDTISPMTQRGYYFRVQQTQGDIVGYPWWDQVGGVRVLWVATTAGRLLRFTDPGAGSGAVDPTADITAPGGAVVFTTPPITADSTTVWVGGTVAGSPRVFAFAADPPAWASTLPTALPDPITSELSTETLLGVTRLFMGGGAAVAGGGVMILQHTFPNSTIAPFAYFDDQFRGTSNPGAASGAWGAGFGQTGGGVRVTLGPNSANMSGGFRATFTVPGAGLTPVRFDLSYRQAQGSENEFDEYGETLVAVDGVLAGSGGQDYVFRIVGDGNGGPAQDTGWQTFSFVRVLTPGAHTLTLGGYYNKSTFDDEVAQFSFDNVTIQTSPSEGRIYRVNTAVMMVDDQDLTPFAPVVAAPFPAYKTGLFVGDQAGQVHGLDHTGSMTPLPTWPKQGGSSPVMGSVWVDFTYKQVLWGDEAGVTHGYTVAGAALTGFPLAAPLGDSQPVRHMTSDAGALWIAGEGGRVLGLDISTRLPISPLYRFGRTAPASSLGFNALGWMLQSGNKVLFLDYATDPTPAPPPPP